MGLFAGYRPKAEGCLELYFFGLSQRATWGASRSVGKGSRRLSGRDVFSGYISGRWRDFLQRISPKLEAAWPERLFRTHFRRLERLFAQYRSKAGGCPELYFFGSSQRAAWGASRSVWKGSRRLSGRNVFSGYISKGWSGFSQRIDQKPKAVWREYFFGVHFQRLEWLFAEDLPKAEGCLELYFFGLSQRATWGASRSVWKGSRKRTGAKTFFRSTCR